jgi:predicted DNA-binding transcriptional regulator YafY
MRERSFSFNWSSERKKLQNISIGIGESEKAKRTLGSDAWAFNPLRSQGAYVLGKGFDLPPLMLTDDEIDAAALGAHWVASRGEPELAAAARRLLAKIEAVVPEHLGSALREPRISVAPMTQAVEAVSAKDIRSAIRLRRKLRIGYRDTHGNETDRTVWPVLVGYRDTSRILAAWCELRQAFRYLRTDRMISVG